MGRSKILLAVLLLATSVVAQERLERTSGAIHVEFDPGKLPPKLAARLADESLAAAVAGWPAVQRTLRPRKDQVFTVHVHGQPSTFRKVERNYRPDKVEMTVAVGPHGEGAHVLVYPLSVRALQQIGLPPTTRQDVVYALASQVAMELMGDKADAWIADLIGLGTMEFFVNPKRKTGVDTRWENRRIDVGIGTKNYRDLITVLNDEQRPANANDFAIRQSWRAVFADQMRKRSSSWATTMMRLWPGARDGVVYVEDRGKAVEGVLGKNWEKTQERFESAMRKLQPTWSSSAPEVWRDGKDMVLVGKDALHAHAYCQADLPKGDYRIRFSVEVEKAKPNSYFRMLLDWDGEELFGVFFNKPGVRVAVMSKGKWFEREATKTVVDMSKPFDVRVESVANHIRVFVDGVKRIDHPCTTRDMHGLWGFAVGDAVVRVRELEVEAVK